MKGWGMVAFKLINIKIIEYLYILGFKANLYSLLKNYLFRYKRDFYDGIHNYWDRASETLGALYQLYYKLLN